MNIQDSVKKLVAYALKTGLIEREDTIYAVNSILIELSLDSADFDAADIESVISEVPDDEAKLSSFLETVLGEIDDYAASNGLLENDSVVYRDLFDTRIMGRLTDRPSNVIKKFNTLYAESPEIPIISEDTAFQRI